MGKLTELESAVLAAMAKQLDVPARESLALQAAEASVSARKNTGAGFFTYFDVGTAASTLPDLRDLAVEAEVEGIEHGVGFILWVKDGHIHFLEGYTYEEATNDLDWQAAKFQLIDP